MFVSKPPAHETRNKRRFVLFIGVFTVLALTGVSVADAATRSILTTDHAAQCVTYSSVHTVNDLVAKRSQNYYHSISNSSGQSINDAIAQINATLAHPSNTSSPADTQAMINKLNAVIDQLNSSSRVSTGQAAAGTGQINSMLGQIQSQTGTSTGAGSKQIVCKSTTSQGIPSGAQTKAPAKTVTKPTTKTAIKPTTPAKTTTGSGTVSQAGSPGIAVSNGPAVSKNRSINDQWAGYVDYGTNFTNVSGSWVVPSVQCNGNGDEVFGAWVGIDGATQDSQTVEQLGSDVECNGREAVQAPWWEMYPGGSHYLDTAKYPIDVGDVLTASVTASGSNFILAISAQSKTHAAWHFSTTQRGEGVKRNSAEWIVEAPTSDGGQNTDIPQFGDFVFTNCTSVMGSTRYKVSQLKGEQTDLRDNQGQIRTQTSALGADGMSFRVSHTR